MSSTDNKSWRMVRWGEDLIDFEEAKKRADEAKELSKGFNLTTTRERTWYEDSWTETVIDNHELARFIEKIRGEKQ